MRTSMLALLFLAPAVQAGTLIAVDRDRGRIHLVDTDSFQKRATVDVGAAPHEVLPMPGGRAWVALYGDQQQPGHELVEVELASGQVLRRIDTVPLLRPHGLVRAGENFYFTAEFNRVVARFDPEAGKVDRVFGLGREVTHMIDIAPDGQQLFTADMLSNTLTRIDFRAGKPFPDVHSYQAGERPEGLALRPDGKEAWVGLNGEGTIRVLDLASGKWTADLDAGSQPARIRFTPDGRYGLTIDPQASTLRVIDAVTHRPVHEHRIAGLPLGMAPTGDSKRVYTTLVEAGAVAEIELETGKVLRQLDLGGVSDGIGLSD